MFGYFSLERADFRGASAQALRRFPDSARRSAGYQLFTVQNGRQPDDWRPMPTIGTGVCEIRITDASGAFRVIYCANMKDTLYVLHAFAKKSRTTAVKDLTLARRRFALACALARSQGHV